MTMLKRLIAYLLVRYRVVLLAGGAVFIGVLGFARISYAQNWITEGLLAAAGGLAGFFGFYIANFLNYVMVKLFSFAGYLIDLGITLNQGMMQHGLIRVGWLITRDIANLGFTIGMIAIAFATILRIEQYGVKKLLWKLIFAALLINFSLTIPGVILDGTHVFSKFFLSKVTGSETALSNFSESIAAAFDIQNLTRTPLDAVLNVNDMNQIFILISNLLFLTLFGTLGIIALGATAFMVFYRYMVLSLLFIIAPLAWIALFLPGFSKYWSEWWDTFFKWALFLPFMTFFFYLAIYTTQSLGNVSIMNIVNNYPANVSLASIPSIGRLAGILGQMVVVLGLMVGGLIVSQKMGIAGASAAIGMAAGVKKFTLGAIKGAAVGAVTGPAKYLGTRPVKAGAMGLANLLNRPALRWIPGAKGAVAGLSGFAQRKEEVAAYKKQYLDPLTPSQLKEVLRTKLITGRGAAVLNPVERAALLSKAVEANMLPELFEDIKSRKDIDDKEKGELIGERVRLFAEAAKRTNPGVEPKDIGDIKALLAYKPSMAPELIGKSEAEATRKFVANDKSHELDIADLSNPAVVMAFTTGHWKNLYENPKAKIEQLTAVERTTNDLVGSDLLEVYKNIAAAEIEIDIARKSGVPQKDRKDEAGNVIEKGIETMRRERLKPWLDKERELLGNPATVTALPSELKSKYTDVAQKLGVKEELRRKLGRDATEDEIILAMRGKAYTQFKNNRQQMGNPFAAFWKKPGEGGAPPGGPGGGPGGAPTGEPTPLTGPRGGIIPPSPSTPAPSPVELTPAGGGVTLRPQPRPMPPRTVEELRKRVEAAGGGVAPAGPTPPLPPKEEGLMPPPPSPTVPRTPTPIPSRPPTPAPARPATPPPPTQPTAIPPRAPTPEPERPPTPTPAREATATPARPATTVPPREATTAPPRAPSTAAAEQGVEAEARRRAEREEAARVATQAREEAEAGARAEKARAEAAERTAAAEEARLKAAERAAEAAARGAEAAKKELESREAALGVAQETGKETEKILREVESGAKATKKLVQDIAALNLRNREDFTKTFMTGDINAFIGAEITTPDNRKRVVKSILRNSPNPMQSTIITAEDERIDLNQLFKYAEKANAPIVIKKKKTTS